MWPCRGCLDEISASFSLYCCDAIRTGGEGKGREEVVVEWFCSSAVGRGYLGRINLFNCSKRRLLTLRQVGVRY